MIACQDCFYCIGDDTYAQCWAAPPITGRVDPLTGLCRKPLLWYCTSENREGQCKRYLPADGSPIPKKPTKREQQTQNQAVMPQPSRSRWLTALIGALVGCIVGTVGGQYLIWLLWFKPM